MSNYFKNQIYFKSLENNSKGPTSIETVADAEFSQKSIQSYHVIFHRASSAPYKLCETSIWLVRVTALDCKEKEKPESFQTARNIKSKLKEFLSYLQFMNIFQDPVNAFHSTSVFLCPPENIKQKLLIFQGVQNETSGMKWVSGWSGLHFICDKRCGCQKMTAKQFWRILFGPPASAGRVL